MRNNSENIAKIGFHLLETLHARIPVAQSSSKRFATFNSACRRSILDLSMHRQQWTVFINQLLSFCGVPVLFM